MAVELTHRLLARIKRDFGPSADHLVDQLIDSGHQDSERVMAAIVLIAKGDPDHLRQAIELSRIDWRDVLVGGDLANEDWRDRLDSFLGPA
ncbi:MAG TPA: hypothetical protein VJT78_06875 [Candidatus Dormibacteraeota bacterium]|nr:hypothetical protein [Candidatus Dormibacteraeota bacterium]